MKNEFGKTGHRLLIFVVVAVLLAWWFFSWMPTWFSSMTFKDHLKNLAGYSGGYPFTQDELMADSMSRAAQDAGVPELNKDYFLHNIQRGAGTFLVHVHYEKNTVMAGTGISVPFKGHLVFNWDITEHSVAP